MKNALNLGIVLLAIVVGAGTFIYSKYRGHCPHCNGPMFMAHPDTAECYDCGAIEHVENLKK